MYHGCRNDLPGICTFCGIGGGIICRLLYNEDHNLFDRLNGISDYTRGYLESIMNAQRQVYGDFFLEDLLTQDILDELSRVCPYRPMSDGTETLSYVYANYFLCRKITSTERLALLKKLPSSLP